MNRRLIKVWLVMSVCIGSLVAPVSGKSALGAASDENAIDAAVQFREGYGFRSDREFVAAALSDSTSPVGRP